MRILFANAHPYLPQLTGGTQINTHYLAKALIARGHAVAICSGLLPSGFRARLDQILIKTGLNRAPRNNLMRYPVYRSWFPQDELEGIASRFRPDVVVVQSGGHVPIWQKAKALRLPVAVYLHNVEYQGHAGRLAADDTTLYIANSEFTARAYKKDFSIDSEVLRPYFDREKFRVDHTGPYVTFFNPHPDKGVDIAIGVASLCPEIDFQFIKTWGLGRDYEEKLRQRLRSLPNVKLLEPVMDTRKIFAETRLLLMPSQFAETWGRVVTEAQFSGIPAVAFDRGGLSESVGAGGLLLPCEADPHVWAATVRDILNDGARYRRLSEAALEQSKRRELDPDYQISFLERLLADLVGRCR